MLRRGVQGFVLRRSKEKFDLAKFHDRYPSAIGAACLYHLAQMRGSVSVTCMSDAKSATARPNILLITSDQQRGDCFGFEGRRVKTPHLDQLAHDGTRFAACITPNVVCQPSRASILTGLLPRTHGVWD